MQMQMGDKLGPSIIRKGNYAKYHPTNRPRGGSVYCRSMHFAFALT